MASLTDTLLESRDEKRLRLADQVRRADDVELPRLAHWNYDACEHHDEPQPLCEYRRCGGPLFRHQRVGVAFYYLRSGILADQTGTGKSNQVLALLCLLKQQGELDRALIVCQQPAVLQWVAEAARFAPGLDVAGIIGDRRKRIQQYAQGWDVAVLSYHMMMRDQDLLLRLAPFSLLVDDDVDPLRNPGTKTARAYNRLALEAGRVVNINATPLQIRLQELFATSISVGGLDVFGSLTQFEDRYVRTEPVTFWVGKKNPECVECKHVGSAHASVPPRACGSKGCTCARFIPKPRRQMTKLKTVGYVHLDEFKQKLTPMYLRRRYSDLDDVRIPDVAPPTDVWLDLHPAQRAKYDALKKGVLEMLKGGEKSIRRVDALAKVTYGAEICSGLFTLGEPDGPEASAKMDWLMTQLVDDWRSEKIIVFTRFRATIKALRARAKKEGIDIAVIWAENREEARPEFRAEEVRRFWEDPKCRVIVGTSAIERSLNLQNANVVVNYDTLLNPARMTQILGRSRRVGSTADRVFVFNIFDRDTQEERYLPVLEQRQALADYVWGEASELYDALTPFELLRLIQP